MSDHPPRNLIVCCDGTWNTPGQVHDGVPVPTNVKRIFNAVEEHPQDGPEQRKYYHSGVGTEGKWFQRLAGGAAGEGLKKNVMSAYHWLAETYQAGDRVFLFGFSRGAYTVRALVGMISHGGLLNLRKVQPGGHSAAWRAVEDIHAAYQAGRTAAESRFAIHGDENGGEGIPIHFVGVWDTVGAYGIPKSAGWLKRLFDTRRKLQFHDYTLSGIVSHGRHALALDEKRANFTPTLWEDAEHDPRIKQIWFPGVHSDVGGGYREIGLSNGALKWMAEEAIDCGLRLDAGMLRQVQANPLDVLHDSATGFFRLLESQPRAIPFIDGSNASGRLNESVAARYANPPIAQAPYATSLKLQKGDWPLRRTIFAAEPWNATGIYLEAGAVYQLSAEGQWKDASIVCGPEGVTGGFHWAYFLANLFMPRRHPKAPWFALVAAVANAGRPDQDGTPAKHEMVSLEKGPVRFSPKSGSGYLYCFANDVWGFYKNNTGSVVLTIERVS